MICKYKIEHLDISGFHVIYNGLETEYLLEQLIPGHSYSIRLSCSNSAGQSECSDVLQIKTPAVAPASCHPPRVSGKPKANSLNLRWGRLHNYCLGTQINSLTFVLLYVLSSS